MTTASSPPASSGSTGVHNIVYVVTEELFVIGTFLLCFYLIQRHRQAFLDNFLHDPPLKPGKAKPQAGWRQWFLAAWLRAVPRSAEPPAAPGAPVPRTASPWGTPKAHVAFAAHAALPTGEQLLEMLRERQFTGALKAYRGAERTGQHHDFTEEVYFQFIISSIRMDKFDIVEKMLDSMRLRGDTPSLPFLRTVLKRLVCKREFQCCLHLLSSFEDRMPSIPDRVVLSCLVVAALEEGQYRRAAELLGPLRRSFDYVGEDEVHEQDYFLFFRTYLALGEAVPAVALAKDLVKQDRVTRSMLGSAIQTCVATGRHALGFGLAREVLQLERQRDFLDTSAFNVLIEGFMQARDAEMAFLCVREMLNYGKPLDDVTVRLLSSQRGSEGPRGLVSTLNRCLPEEDGQDGTFLPALWAALVKAGALGHAAELCLAMRRRGAPLEAGPNLSLLQALLEKQKLEYAILLARDLVAAGCYLDDTLFATLIYSCRQKCDQRQHSSLFKDLVAAGAIPGPVTLTAVLKLVCEHGAPGEAVALLKGWEEAHGQRPQMSHCTCLVNSCVRLQRMEEAWAVYEYSLEQNIEADDMFLAALMPGLVSSKAWGRVATLANCPAAAACSGGAFVHAIRKAIAQMRHQGLDEQVQDVAKRLPYFVGLEGWPSTAGAANPGSATKSAKRAGKASADPVFFPRKPSSRAGVLLATLAATPAAPAPALAPASSPPWRA